jgi:hypothetical protein
MRKPLILLALVLAAAASTPVAGNAPPPPKEEKVREIFVPFDDLHVLLEGPTERVLLSREQYEELLAKAKKSVEGRAPREALLASADYVATAGDERAEIAGTLALSVLEDGLHAVALDVAGVGLRGATLDGKSAPIGLADDGRLTVFVEGKGQHKLALEMVAPIQTTAARQILNFHLPMPAATTLRLTVPGDVEVKSGAPVIARTFDEAAGQTRIELLPQHGDVSLVMTLNSRLKRKDRVVVARSVLVDEVTASYERLHATVSMAVLHRAVDQFRFAVPAGFEVTDVRSPQLARWAIATEGGRRILEVQLREETTETTVLNLSVVRASPDLAAWALPKLEPLDVVGHVAVVCLAVEDRLKAEGVAAEGLIPIDTSVLMQALPATVLEAQPGAARIRPVVAYYAPRGEFSLAARFVKPPASLRVTTNLLAVLEDGGLQIRGGFALAPEEEKLFSFDFSVPAGWDVTSVTGENNEAVSFERYGAAGQAGRVHVRLATGAPAGTERRVFFTAVHVPKGWLGDWSSTGVDFPAFVVAGAARDEGAIAVDARDDMTVRPEALERLTPLDENEKTRYGLAGVSAALAYRYEAQPYKARLTVERTLPRLTAQTYSFFRVQRDALAAHYELVYDVTQARTRRLALVLPKDTPTALSIRGLGGVALKEYLSEEIGEKGKEQRRWTAILADRRSGTVRLAVDFEQRRGGTEVRDLLLPVIQADGVAYQTGLVAVEGSPELDVSITEHPRRVDIGELVDAEYQPGRRLLGAYGFLGLPPAVKVSVAQHPGYGLPPAIVQRVELATVMSADGVAQTAARFLLRTKALFLEVKLPPGSSLWSATLDSKPTKPQREGDSLLVSLPAGAEGTLHNFQLVYETSIARLGLWGGVGVLAPRLALHAGPQSAGEEVPIADLVWKVYTPSGYRVVRAEGSVATDKLAAPPLALASMAGFLWHTSGGVNVNHGAIGLVLGMGSRMAPRFADEYAGQRGAAEMPQELHEGDWAGTEEANAPMKDLQSDESTVRGGYRGDASRGAAGTRSFAYKTGEKAKPEEAAGGKPSAPRKPVGGPAAGLMYSGRPDGASLRKMNDGTGNATAGATLTLNGDALALVPTTPAAPGAAPTVMTPPPPPVAEPVPAKKEPLEKRKVAWALEGVSSLKIDLETSHDAAVLEFHSLGSEPRLALTIVDEPRLEALAWGVALAVFLAGMALTRQTVARKTAYVIGVGLVATLVPVIPGPIELALVFNGAFWAACLLVAYYLAAGAARWMAAALRRLFTPHAAAGTALLVMAAMLGVGGAWAAAAEGPPPYIIQVVPPPEPVKVPADALILPYDPATQAGIKGADKLLVPYAKYVELWNLAYPEKPLGEHKPPAPYALAGASLSASLKGDEYMLVEGYIDIDVYTNDYAIVPLPLEGGVLAKADLDGKPAKLSVTVAAATRPQGLEPAGQARQGVPQPAPQQAGQAKNAAPEVRPPPRSFIVLYASGKGRHRLDVAVRMRLEKRGGWRVAEGRLPAAPATALALRAPDAGTEIRLGGIPDRRTYETKAADQVLNTALAADGALSIQWRPKVSEGQTDTTLTAQSSATLDVQEDSLRLAWALHLEFRHGEREFFTVEVPAGYMVEKVEGTNVRGWELKTAGGRQELEVALLKRAKGAEDFAVSIWRPADKAAGEFDVPLIGVTGAVRHSGELVIRRSPLLDLRTVSTNAVTRADLPVARPPSAVRNTQVGAPGPQPADESPLGIRPYQAYRFVATPFVIRLASEPVAAKVAAAVQTLLKVAERERNVESRVLLVIENRPLYRARFVVPADLKIDRVLAPGTFEWALTDPVAAATAAGRKVLTIYLASGIQGSCPIVIQGKLGLDRQGLETAVPRLEVLDVDRQQGDIVVQVDPAFDVRADGLESIERVLLERTFGWLNPGQRTLAQLALHYTRPDYAGRLVLTARKADVTCFTVTNSRVTDRAIEDAVLVTWTIKNAGIREVAFLLPAWMKDARISVPLLRQKTVTPVADDPSRIRVQLQLQDEVMDELRVLVENDRLLAGGSHDVPIPEVETGRTDRRYAAVESAGRDEVQVEKDGLEPLSRQQKEWATVSGLLRGGMTQAFVVAAGAEKPHLAFLTKERAAVETAKARIGLAKTVLVMDASGAYRAEQVYHLDNRTEQFLEIQMPEGAALWTAIVAGEPVKPTLVNDPARPRHVNIPIVKTAAGDLDYAVILKYGGKLESLEALRTSVTFPLIRAVNINAELSQVELHLPPELDWFYFRGKMSPVAEVGEFQVGKFVYLGKAAERLMQTARSDNPFAQARAKSNLKTIVQSMQSAQEKMGRINLSTASQTEVSNVDLILRNAEKEVQQEAQPGQAAVYDNNDFIRDAYNKQKNTRARNQVTALGGNWAETPVQQPATPQARDGQATFNDNWLAANRLENKPAEAAKVQAESRLSQFDVQNQSQIRLGAQQAGQQPALSGKQMFQKFSEEGDKSKAAGQVKQDELLSRSNVQDLVQRYQQKLEQRVDKDQKVAQQQAQPQRDELGALEAIGMGGGGREGRDRGRGRLAVGGEGETAGLPAGMASLDFQLPTRDDPEYPVYRFTTPRGDVEVTASAASQPLVEGLQRVGGVAALVIVVLVIRRLARGRSFGLQTQSTLSTVLIVLGIIGMFVGILPVASLIAIVIGVIMKIHLFRVRRRPAAA